MCLGRLLSFRRAATVRFVKDGSGWHACPGESVRQPVDDRVSDGLSELLDSLLPFGGSADGLTLRMCEGTVDPPRTMIRLRLVDGHGGNEAVYRIVGGCKTRNLGLLDKEVGLGHDLLLGRSGKRPRIISITQVR